MISFNEIYCYLTEHRPIFEHKHSPRDPVDVITDGTNLEGTSGMEQPQKMDNDLLRFERRISSHPQRPCHQTQPQRGKPIHSSEFIELSRNRGKSIHSEFIELSRNRGNRRTL